MLQRGGISMWQHMAATEFARPTPITSNHAEAQTIFLSFLILVGSAWNFEWCRFIEFRDMRRPHKIDSVKWALPR
jgi:hypothetical protein